MRVNPKTVLVAVAAWLSVTCCDAFGQTNGIPRDVETALENADSFTLFSIDPLGSEFKVTNTFQGGIILGQVDVQSKATRLELINALDNGISVAEETGQGADLCFNPRHGIRARKGDETVELLICFECHQIYITSRSHTNELFTTTGDPAVIFNKVLKDADVPLTPQSRVYYVGGEVVHPGPELYLGKTTVTKAIQAAGGFTRFAPHDVWLECADGTRIHVNVDKALADATHDPPVYPGDKIIVPRRYF